ncbi:family 1 encapsulin nanocompartment shell protein, partial [Nocardia sp. JW2]|uniref:family 1 encapsulin nanocompartment shell protein n=1 Tax=Nocardia sp. JW2 TaxID=3450738 RepID=UPI003F44181E
MNNLHRELAPITDEAWTQIEEEATRTFKRNIAGRRVVDVSGPRGVAYSALNRGRLTLTDSPDDGVQAHQRVVQPLVELRVPFTLQRSELDDIERGAPDADLDNLKDAAQKIA